MLMPGFFYLYFRHSMDSSKYVIVKQCLVRINNKRLKVCTIYVIITKGKTGKIIKTVEIKLWK